MVCNTRSTLIPIFYRSYRHHMPLNLSLALFEQGFIELPTSIFGWLLLLAYIAIAVGLGWYQRARLWPLLGQRWVWIIIFCFAALISSGIQIRLGNGLLLPQIARTETPTLAIHPFGLWFPFTVGALFGPLAALIVGLFEGAGRALWSSHQLFDLPLIGITAWITAMLMQQRYRERLFRLLRLPPVAALLTVLLFTVPARMLNTFAYVPTDSTLISALDLALFTGGGQLVVSLIEGLSASLIAWLAFTLWRERFGRSGSGPAHPLSAGEEERLSPFSQKFAIQLMGQFLLYSIILLLLVTVTVSTIAYNSARNLLQSEMIQDGLEVNRSIAEFQNVRVSILSEGGKDPRLLGSADEQSAHLADIFRTGTFFRRVLLVERGPDGAVSIKAAYPPFSDSLSLDTNIGDGNGESGRLLHPVEEMALSEVAGDRIATVSKAGNIEAEEAVIAVTAPVPADPSLYLIGRIPTISLNRLIRDLDATSDAGLAYIVDESNRIIAHSANENLLTEEPIPVEQTTLITGPESNPSAAETGFSRDRGVLYRQLDSLSNTRELEYRLRGESHPWTTVIEVPVEVILRRAVETAGPAVLIILPATILFAIFLAWRGTQLHNRLDYLLTAAQSIAGGNYDTPIEVTDHADDLGQLGVAFSNMQGAMRQRLREGELLLQASQRASDSLNNLDEGAASILQSLLRGTGAAGGRMVVTSRGHVPNYGEGPAADKMEPFDRQLLPRIQEAGELILPDPVTIREQLQLADDDELPFQAIVGYALRGARDYGALWLAYRQPKRFAVTELNLIRSMSQQASVMVQNDFLFSNAERGRRQLDTVIANTPDPVIVTDPFNRISYFNPAAITQLELDPRGTQWRPMLDIFKQPELEAVFSPDQRETVSIELPMENGKIFVANISPILRGENRRRRSLGRVAIFRDITELKELDELKSDFVRLASHELRNPITVAKTALAMMPLVGQLNESQTEKYHILEVRLIEMETLVNDLLDLGRLEAGLELELFATQLKDVVREVVQRLTELAETNGVELHYDPPKSIPLLQIDTSLVRQAISNLVANAIKYAPNSGPITITIEHDQTKEEVVVCVKDLGPGIPLDKQKHIWDKFYRAKQKGQETIRGNGLGLSIVKTVMDRHAGRAWLDSIPGAGCRFYVAFPINTDSG